MRLANIFSKLSKNPEEKRENFLALEITNEMVKAAVWSVVGENVEVLRLGSCEEWEEKEDLLKAADVAVTSACGGITPEPEKVIFGLPQDWVEAESIISSKKAILANLCENLALKPVGFVVSLEAIIAYLKLKQGTPPSAIFVRLGQTEIVVSLVSLGKIRGSQKVGRSEDLALDIKEGLARFGRVESLPARIILFDGLIDFEEAKQQIISFDWLSRLPFLHFPKVESFKRDFTMKAIAVAGGSEVAKSLGFQIRPSPKKKILQDEEVGRPEEKIEEEGKVSARDLGFVEEKDIRQMPKKKEERLHPKGDLIQKPQLEAGQSLAETDHWSEFLLEKKEEEELPEKEEKEVLAQSARRNLKALFSNLLSFFVLPLKIFPKKGAVLLILPFLVLIFASVFVWWYIPRARVVIYFSPQNIEEEISFKLDPMAESVDEEKKIIPAQELTIEVEGESQEGTSGEKRVGEKAHGKATIYNKTEMSKTFAQGTVLVGEDNLKFVLEEEVEVASRSTQTTSEGEEITWGKATAEISASSIGEESNASSGASFVFKDYATSAFVAKTEEGLTGGSARKVKIVTREDQERLLEKLTSQLEEKGKEELRANLSAEKVILDKNIKTEIIKKEFDKKVEDEGESLNLELGLKFTTFSFFKKDLQQIARKQLSQRVPGDLTLIEDNFQTVINKVEVGQEQVEIEMVVKAGLRPDLEIEKIKSDLAGKSTEKAKDYLLGLPNFVRATIDISPSLLGKLKTLPRIAKNIEIELEVE